MLRRVVTAALMLVLLVSLAGCTVWGEHKPTVWKDVTGGESLERVFWHEVQAKHWTDLESHLAPNFVLTVPTGTFDRAAALEHWKDLQVQDYSLGEIQSQLNGNTYTVTYILNIHATRDGRSLPTAPLRAMSVWQRQVREQWVMLAHSAMSLSTGNEIK
ncbi:MAG TPA: nuclear transport factor 2 family protein [Terriglobales bacterium]|nr:nuclear transport factor 2 family protein [Terriglobales bacterium]